MPIIRKIFQIGNSKAVCIPKDWLEYYEKETGTRIEAVAIEVNRILKIAPPNTKTNKTAGRVTSTWLRYAQETTTATRQKETTSKAKNGYTSKHSYALEHSGKW